MRPLYSQIVHQVLKQKAHVLEKIGEYGHALRILAKEVMDNPNRPEKTYESLIRLSELCKMPLEIIYSLSNKFAIRFPEKSTIPAINNIGPYPDLIINYLIDEEKELFSNTQYNDLIFNSGIQGEIAYTACENNFLVFNLSTGKLLWKKKLIETIS